MMEQTDFCGILSTFCPTILVKYQEPMASHTSFRIGGPSQAMAFPKDEGELSALLALAAKEGWPVRILGAGTNVLAPDEGLAGLTICLKDCLDGDTLLDNCDLAQLLGVTQRTIARYREKGLIRYYQTDENGKNFYRSSEIQDFLRQRGKKK